MTQPSFDIPYLHASEVEEEELVLATQLTEPGASFTVNLGEDHIKYSPEKFLQACWTNGFSTPCSVCKEPFNVAISPPVRLLSLGQDVKEIDPLTAYLPPLTITNYHLKCLKTSQLRYFPVSHAWRPSISEAYALRKFSADAAQACYEVPVRTLLAVVRQFGPNVFLWHDYISIPQWQDEFRGTAILPQIFEVFRESSCAIIHLGLQPPLELLQGPSLRTLMEQQDDLKRFFSAHLFSRLWPVVEFSRAREAYVMSSKYEIMENTFSLFMTQIMQATTTASLAEEVQLQWVYDLPLFARERQPIKCLGYVYDMISQQKCHSSRDKYIGAAELLGIPDYPITIPQNPADTCLWLTEIQLNKDDFSSLLLRPPVGERSAKARWLRGHELITADMWSLGNQTKPALVTPRLDGLTIHLELHLAGTVSHAAEFATPSTRADPRSQEVLSLLNNVSACSTREYVQSMQGLGPDKLLMAASSTVNIDFVRMKFDVPESGILDRSLGALRSRLRFAQEAKDDALLEELQKSMISILALSASDPMPDLKLLSDLTPLQLCRHLHDSLECTLISIACQTCSKKSIVRASIWQQSEHEVQLYYIPGLEYQYSTRNGTGILVANGEIIGRVRYGAPACKCNHSVVLKLT